MTTIAATNMPARSADLPVAVIGAGPQGLAVAAHLRERGFEPLVLEKGDTAGASVGEWGDVQTFSEWPELVDQAARRLLEPTGWSAPSTGFPTGREWADRYLIPLAAALGAARVRTGARVVGVARAGRFALLQDEWFESAFEQVRGGGEALGARADDGDGEVRRRGRCVRFRGGAHDALLG